MIEEQLVDGTLSRLSQCSKLLFKVEWSECWNVERAVTIACYSSSSARSWNALMMKSEEEIWNFIANHCLKSLCLPVYM